MTPVRLPLSRSQRNIYNGVAQDNDPALYLIGRRYRFHPVDLPVLLSALEATIRASPVQLCVLAEDPAGDYPVLVPTLAAQKPKPAEVAMCRKLVLRAATRWSSSNF